MSTVFLWHRLLQVFGNLSTRALYGVYMALGYVFQDEITDEKRYVATISDTRENIFICVRFGV